MVQRSGHIKGFSTRRHKKNTSIKRIETDPFHIFEEESASHKKNTSIKRIEIALPAGRRLMLHHP